MCDPATALAGASVALGGLSAVNQYQNSRYQAAQANANADAATAQAEDAINRGNAAADQRRSQMRQQLGSQAAALGANGAELSSGSALNVFGDTAQFGELDALTTLNNATREAYGYQTQAQNFKSQGRSAARQGTFGAVTTLLTAPLNAYGAYKMGGGTWSPFSQSAAPISAAVGTPTGR